VPHSRTERVDQRRRKRDAERAGKGYAMFVVRDRTRRAPHRKKPESDYPAAVEVDPGHHQNRNPHQRPQRTLIVRALEHGEQPGEHQQRKYLRPDRMGAHEDAQGTHGDKHHPSALTDVAAREPHEYEGAGDRRNSQKVEPGCPEPVEGNRHQQLRQPLVVDPRPVCCK
jgi:hypothetical protein